MSETRWRAPGEEVAARFSRRRILVVGDHVVDRYVFAEPTRLSREAPVVIARLQEEKLIPGGAANAVRNLLALGAEVLPVGILGDDEEGRWLRRHFEGIGLDVRGLVTESGRPTVSKTRYLVGEASRTKQQVLRIDREPPGGSTDPARESARAALRELVPGCDAVLLSDYGYGLCDAATVEEVLALARGMVVTADSRYGIDSFRGITLATPNETEVEAWYGRPFSEDPDALEKAGRSLLVELDAPALLVTRGNRGMALFERDRERVDIAVAGSEEVTDVSGAGDTVIAVVTLALAAGASPELAARIANVAAGVTVMKIGAATCSREELAAAWREHTA